MGNIRMAKPKRDNRPGQRPGGKQGKTKDTSSNRATSKGNSNQQQQNPAKSPPAATNNQAPKTTENNQAGSTENRKQFWDRHYNRAENGCFHRLLHKSDQNRCEAAPGRGEI